MGWTFRATWSYCRSTLRNLDDDCDCIILCLFTALGALNHQCGELSHHRVRELQ
jgi:hypothetical protein